MIIMFDLEDVLVESVGRRAAAARAAGLYLEAVCKVMDGQRLTSTAMADALSAAGGFEDPIDLASAIILSFLARLAPPLRPPPPRKISRLIQIQEAFAEKHLRYGELLALAEADLTPIIESIEARGGGWEGTTATFGRDSISGYILRPIVARLVDAFFLGDARFESVWAASPRWPQGAGLLDEEVAVVSAEILTALSEKASIASFSRRRGAVMRWSLERLGMLASMEAVVGLEDLGAPPPSPAGLIEAQKRCGKPEATVYVVSAAVDVITAARAAGFQAVGLTRRLELHTPLKRAGARAVMGKPKTLHRVLGQLIDQESE